MNTAMMIKLLILAGAAFLLGYLLGRRTKHTYGGEIVFEKQPDGKERCAFMLENDDDWLSRQKSVVFKVEHATGSKEKNNTPS